MNNTVHIVGRLDCNKTTLVRLLIEELKKKKENNNEYDIVLAFETPFESYMLDLIKRNVDVLKYNKSPFIYTENSGEIDIIGNFDEFLKWSIAKYSFYEDRDPDSLNEFTLANLEKYIESREHQYAFIDINDSQRTFRVVFELFNSICPKTVANFMALCKGFINSGFKKVSMKGSKIPRIVKNGFIHCGKILNEEGAKSVFGCEFADENYDVKHDYPGIIGMIKKDNRRHTNENEFYITLNQLNYFDGKYVAFGRVVSGLKELLELSEIETYLQKPLNEITIVDCGEHKFTTI